MVSKINAHAFRPRAVSVDLLKSPTLARLRRELYEALLGFGVEGLGEMESIEALAKELGGKPHNSTQYLQAEALVDTLKTLKDLMDNNYSFVRPAETAEGAHP